MTEGTDFLASGAQKPQCKEKREESASEGGGWSTLGGQKAAGQALQGLLLDCTGWRGDR